MASFFAFVLVLRLLVDIVLVSRATIPKAAVARGISKKRRPLLGRTFRWQSEENLTQLSGNRTASLVHSSASGADSTKICQSRGGRKDGVRRLGVGLRVRVLNVKELSVFMQVN